MISESIYYFNLNEKHVFVAYFRTFEQGYLELLPTILTSSIAHA